MDIIKTVATTIVGGWSVGVIAKTLLGIVVTGTTVGDQLLLNTVPVIIGAGGWLTGVKLFLRGV